jgi:hypothetical protein
VHALSQQTPSTQRPDPHSVLIVHAVPSGLLHVPVVPALHVIGAVHDADPQHTPSVQCAEVH